MKKVITVKTYLEERAIATYGKKVRILESGSHRNLGAWYENNNALKEVKEVKASAKYLFIFV